MPLAPPSHAQSCHVQYQGGSRVSGAGLRADGAGSAASDAQSTYAIDGKLGKEQQLWTLNVRMVERATGEVRSVATITVDSASLAPQLQQSRLAAGVGDVLARRLNALLEDGSSGRATAATTSGKVAIEQASASINQTTRERFAVHSKDAACAACHKTIDPIGFSFEWLDGMGRERMMENGHPIDSSAQLMAGLSVDGSYPDSAALSAKIGTSPELASCFAKRLFHSAAASNTDGAAVEQAFVAQVEALPPESRGKLQELLVAFAGSELFVKRGAQ